MVTYGQLTLLAGKHGLVDASQHIGIVRLVGKLVNAFAHHQRLVRADHNLSATAYHCVKGIGINLDAPHQFGEPIQRYVGGEDGGHLAVAVLDGQ